MSDTGRDDQLLQLLLAHGDRLGWRLRVPQGSPERDYPPVPSGKGIAADLRLAREKWAWQDRIRVFEEQERQRLGNGMWFPASFQHTHATVAVFGGTRRGWESLLTTVGASMLGSGYAVTVCDLTQRHIGRRLHDAAKYGAYTVASDRLGEGGATLDFFAGLRGSDLISLLFDILQPSERDDHRSDVGLDKAVLRRVVERLDPPLTLARLVAAFGIVLREGGDGLLRSGEVAKLKALYGPEIRQRTGVIERVHRWQAEIERLLPYVVVPQVDSRSRPTPGADLHFFELAADVGFTDLTLVSNVLVQATLRRARRTLTGSRQSPAFVILGADRIPSTVLEELTKTASGGPGRVILFFERLREASADALGMEAGFAFMRLTHPEEAKQSAEFIGRIHRFVVSQVSTGREQTEATSRGVNITNTAGKHHGLTLGLGLGVNFGSDTSVAAGQSTEHSTSSGFNVGVTQSREYEYIVEPRVIQQLEEHDVVLVEAQPGDVIRVNCDPAVLYGRHGVAPVSREPYSDYPALPPRA